MWLSHLHSRHNNLIGENLYICSWVVTRPAFYRLSIPPSLAPPRHLVVSFCSLFQWFLVCGKSCHGRLSTGLGAVLEVHAAYLEPHGVLPPLHVVSIEVLVAVLLNGLVARKHFLPHLKTGYWQQSALRNCSSSWSFSSLSRLWISKQVKCSKCIAPRHHAPATPSPSG